MIQDKRFSPQEEMDVLHITSMTTLQKLQDKAEIWFSQPTAKKVLYDRDSLNKYLNAILKYFLKEEDRTYKKGFNNGYFIQQDVSGITHGLNNVKYDNIYLRNTQNVQGTISHKVKERFKVYTNYNLPSHSKDKVMSKERQFISFTSLCLIIKLITVLNL